MKRKQQTPNLPGLPPQPAGVEYIVTSGLELAETEKILRQEGRVVLYMERVGNARWRLAVRSLAHVAPPGRPFVSPR
jgi:hypothetical protein